MRVYLAARYSRRAELLGHAELLATLGCEVVSRWILGDHELAAVDAESRTFATAERARFATEDLRDIRRSDLVICFTEPPKSEASRGGCHVEMGIAIGLGKEIVVIGPPENVFCCLPRIALFEKWTDFLDSRFPLRPVEGT